MRDIFRSAFRLVLVLAMVMLSSCSQLLGWGIVLWTVDPDAPAPYASTDTGTAMPAAAETARKIPGIASGSLVPVYIKSNINRVYVVGVPNSSEKTELPFWNVVFFDNKAKAERYAAKFAAFAARYAITLRDGLFLRKAPSNVEKAVYRFRERETLKLLEKAKGEPVMTGGTALPGDWYLAMSADGTQGYVFSNQLQLYDESTGGKPVVSDSSGEQDDYASMLFSGTWRPDYFAGITEESRVDLSLFEIRFGLFPDGVTKSIHIEVPGFSRTIRYDEITRASDGRFRFDEQDIYFTLKGNENVSFVFEENGESENFDFIKFPGDIRTIIRFEELRRNKLLEALSGRSPFLSASGSGVGLSRSGTFTWIAGEGLPSGFLPEGSGYRGTFSLNLIPSQDMETSWDGGCTMTFESGNTARFAIKLSDTGVRLARIPDDGMQGSRIMGLGGSPLMIELDGKAE